MDEATAEDMNFMFELTEVNIEGSHDRQARAGRGSR